MSLISRILPGLSLSAVAVSYLGLLGMVVVLAISEPPFGRAETGIGGALWLVFTIGALLGFPIAAACVLARRKLHLTIPAFVFGSLPFAIWCLMILRGPGT